MSRIQLANLPSAGSTLFQGSESFLTELQSTEAHAIFGGKGHGGKGSSNKGSSKKGSRSGSGRGYGGCCPPSYCPPAPCH
jgi:hypothetical protein